MKKRIVTLLLTLLTVLSLLPTVAMAAESTGVGITPVTDPNLWTTRLNSQGQTYSYRPPTAAGRQLYCMDLGYSYRSGTESFLQSYMYRSATGADADALWNDAVAETGLGEMDAITQENVKWMMSYIADYTGKTLQTENMAFDYLLASLQKGDFDIVIAAMEATDERKEAADFSDPYYTDYPPMILVKKENADQYKTLADFDGKAVGAQTGTTKADIVTNDMPGANLVALQLVTDLVNQLMYDKVDAVVVDGSVANQYVAENDDFVIAEASSELGAAEPYCVAVQKGDPKGLLPGINEAIAEINSENKIEEFIALADSLSGVAEEVSADAPAE